MKLNGSQILIECLKEQGVDTIFGYPGGAILNVYDELYRHKEIRHILTSHEQGASHAADGYARATGKVGVCFATSGPGATNLVTGIATAYMDSVPLVAVTCNVGISLLGRDSFQEVDIYDITMPITKHNFIVKDIHQLADTVRRAFRIAKEGRPGPVLIDLTKNVTADQTEYEPVTPVPILPYTDAISSGDLALAAEMIRDAKKPVVFVGGGAVISNAQEELKEFVSALQAPVCDSLMGKGAFPGTDPLYLGMLGMHGTKASNLTVSHSDLLVVVGARFSDRVIGNPKQFARGAKILQIDIDPAEINKNIRVDLSIIGDVKEVLKRLTPMIGKNDHSQWIAESLGIAENHPLKYDRSRLSGPFIMEEVYRLTDGDARIVTEVGQHQMWAAQYFRYKEPHQLFTSGGLGTMGYGLGAAIGVKTGRPDKIVVNVAGDGCLRMNMNELATAARYNIPVIELVMDNHVLGMVHQWQELFYGGRYSHTIFSDKVDYVKLAEAMGCAAFRVTQKEEFEPVFRRALELNGPVLIDCIIDEDDKVFPMVPAGHAISEVFDQDDLEGKRSTARTKKKDEI
jgi:acetolactate synthase-1/2/3 large subunit